MVELNTAYQQQSLHKRITSRQGDLETTRSPVDAQRHLIVEHLRPDLVRGQIGEKDEGAFQNSKIIEGTGPHALRVWARGFRANLISRKEDWFREQVKEPVRGTGITFKGNDQVNRYCQDLADHMRERYRRSNYYEKMPLFVLDGGSIGSPVLLSQPDIPNDRMVFEVPDYAGVYLSRDIFGEDNVLHVLREWTALQAMQMFGMDQLPKVVKQQLRNGQQYAKTKYLQAIYAAGDPIYDDLEDMPQTRPWMEHFICMAANSEREEVILKPKNKGPGYFSRPFSSWHYHRNDHEIYARTMAWWSIYDIKGSNDVLEALFADADYGMAPATWALKSQQGRLDLSPQGSNWARDATEYEAKPEFLERNQRFELPIEVLNMLLASVRRHFHYDFFMAVNSIMASKSQPETAYGLQRAQAENGVQLVEEIESFEQQQLGATHDMMMDYERLAEPAYEWGRLPEPPDILKEYGEGKDNVRVEFIGPLSMMEINDRQVQRFYRAMAPAELIFNSSNETINKAKWPEILEWLWESQDFPQNFIRPQAEYDDIIRAVEQRAMQAQLAENAPKLAQGVKNLQGTTEKSSPLAAMAGART